MSFDSRRRSGCDSPPVHPRGCGEQAVVSRRPSSRAGSSPRVRGTDHRHRHARGLSRFIPAGAGNSVGDPAGGAAGTVHPRGCGEQPPYHLTSIVKRGSSPRVRGTAHPAADGGADRRFIPAGAGNRAERCPHPRARSVHPRGCGEQIATAVCGSWLPGSSPRVRGTGLRREWTEHGDHVARLLFATVRRPSRTAARVMATR